MNTIPLAALLAAVLVAPLAAQNDLRRIDIAEVTLAVRGIGLGADLTRVDDLDLFEWGLDPANPGKRKITGFAFLIQDFDLTTQELFYLVAYGEDAANPDFPDRTKQFGKSGLWGLPTTPPFPGSNGAMYEVRQSFQTPMLADAGEDTFIGVEYTSSNLVTPPTDGLFTLAVDADTSFASYDLPGPGVIAQGSYLVALSNTAGIAPTYPFQGGGAVAFDLCCGPLLESATVVGGTITNQSTFTFSNVAPGTTLGLSGHHPDAGATPLNPGRADDLTFNAMDARIANSLWFVFVGFDPNPLSPMPISQIPGVPAGSSGNVCVDLATVQQQALVIANSNGLGEYTAVIPANIRAIIGPGMLTRVIWQGIGIDAATLEIHATNCAAQHLQ